MAKLPPDNWLMPGRGVRQRKRWYTATRRGVTYASSTPHRISGSYTPAELERQKVFKGASVNVAYMSTSQQLTARLLAERSTFAVRDYLTRCIFARMFRVPRPDGKVYYAMVARNDVSQLLEPLGQTKGDMLWRGENWWQSIPWGSLGQVLTIVNEDEPPEWREPQVGGDGMRLSTTLTLLTTSDTTASAFKGFVHTPEYDILVGAIWLRHASAAGIVLKAMVATVDNENASGTLSDVHLSPAHTIVAGGNDKWTRVAFDTPIAVAAGTKCLLAIGRSDGADNYALPMRGSTTGAQTIPMPGNVHGFMRITKAAPANGDAYTYVNSVNAVGMGVEWGPDAG